ncbi:MAG: transcriptional regulator [Alteromonadaceae bacterium]|nr:MAG: transcriptional regulator [Alteromonadaceae bacterium]
MQSSKQKKLEQNGWKVGSASDFLELTPEEEAYIELKLSLCRTLKKIRTRKHLTQSDLAKKINSSQSRVAKMEAGDASVSLDLVIKSLFSAGASSKDIRNAIPQS